MAEFYVNRGGGRVPEGPFTEQQIIQLILAGKVSSGHVSAVGSQRFFPIASHPPFAQALLEAGAPPDRSAAPRVTQGSTKTNRGLVLAAVLCIFGLALAAVAIGTYVMFQNGAMPIRGAVPTDTELLVEVRSIPQLLTDLHAVHGLDVGRYQNAQQLDDTAQAFTDSFGVPKAQVKALILAASSLGIAGRKLGGAAEGGVLMSFTSASAVNAFLSSKRFTYAGLVAKNGRKYTLLAGTPPPSANVDAARRALVALALNGQSATLVWFETSKVLFLGSPSFAESVARVVSLDVPSIELSPTFALAQRDFTGKPNVTGYFDGKKASESGEPLLRAWLASNFKGIGPISARLELVPAGLLSHFIAHVPSVTPAAAAVATGAAAPLSVVDRLPAETFAYVAARTESASTGAELEQRLLDQLGAASPPLAEQARAELARAEPRWHVRPADILGSLGDQAAFGVLAHPDYSVVLGDPTRMLADFGFVYLQALKDEAPARAACKAWSAQLSSPASPFSIAQDADGYLLSSADGALTSRVRFDHGYLFLAFGGAPLVERAWRAFSQTENTLAADAAHRAARAALPSTGQSIAWLDVGRIVDAVQKNPILAVKPWQLGFDAVRQARWTGPDRFTAGLVLSSEQKSGVGSYRVDALNWPIAAGLYGLLAP